MAFTLSDIRQVIRDVTGNPTEAELSTASLDDLINKFYLYVLPDDLKPFRLLVDYKFNTLENQVFYDFDLETYVSLEPEFFCNGVRLFYYQNRSLWLRDYQYQYTQESGTDGDGVTTAFSGTTNQTPIVDGTFSIADNVESFFDNGDGTLTGSQGGTGSIVYSTGSYSVNFNTAPASGQTLQLTYAPLINGRPRAMYYDGDGTIQFSPIPDGTYEIKGSAYIMPTAFIESGVGSQTPMVQYWGYVISYGTSLEIFRRRGQFEQLDLYKPEYEKYLDLALSRSTQQDSNQRAIPKW